MHEGLGETIIFCIGAEAVQLAFKVVSDNVELVEGSPPSLCCGEVSYISEPKDIVIFIMPQSFMVDI